MRTCINCALSENIPSVRLNPEGLCNYCVQHSSRQFSESPHSYTGIEEQLQAAFAPYRSRAYQVLLAYSGGKDSTFTLYKLRRSYDVSVLAVTFDNGFMTDQCRRNIQHVTTSLDVDSIIVKPSFARLARLFNLAASQKLFPPKALERASSICTACIGLVKSMVYREAISRKIPYLCFGWTPGQTPVKAPVVRLDYRMVLANQRQVQAPIVANLGQDYDRFFIDPEWLEDEREYVPALVYPLVFSPYDENQILKQIESIGWRKPQDTDTNSTNCLLNSYANYLHCRDYGYNPYSMEVAGLIREGFLNRQEGIRKLSYSGDEAIIKAVQDQLDKYRDISEF